MFNEETLITNLMAKAPACYHDVLFQELMRLGDKITMDDLKKALELRWRLKSNGDRNEDSETALILTANLRCKRCGKSGHTAKNSWHH